MNPAISSAETSPCLCQMPSSFPNSAGASVIEVGRPIYTFYLSKTAGVDPATGKRLYYAYWKRGVDETGAVSNVRCDEYVTDNVSLASLSKYYMGSREPAVSGRFSTQYGMISTLL